VAAKLDWAMIEHRSEVDLRISARTGCFIAIGIGLLLIALLWSVVLLAVQGEVSIQGADLTGFRLWMITLDGHTGLGLSRTRSVSAEQDENDEYCVETTTHFLLLGSSAPEPAKPYCECYQEQDGQWQYVGVCDP
jgi:hypothetical protein